MSVPVFFDLPSFGIRSSVQMDDYGSVRIQFSPLHARPEDVLVSINSGSFRAGEYGRILAAHDLERLSSALLSAAEELQR